MNITNGLSGCKLELVSSNVLRKYSSSKFYNERLYCQFNKQQLFSNFVLKNIETPKTFGMQKESLYYFDMEYIKGHLFEEHFAVSNIHDIHFVIQSLFGYFDFLISNKRYYKPEVSKTIITNKIIDLESKTNYPGILNELKSFVLDEELYVPKTFCHGDLTFTNIIFHKNRLYFIDFLDCFIDSFYCDLVKLKQDLYYGWSFKIQKISSLRLQRIYSFIWNEIEKRYLEYIDTTEFKILDLLNTLRLDPYLTDPRQKIIINEMIQKSDLYENFNCPNGGAIK